MGADLARRSTKIFTALIALCLAIAAMLAHTPHHVEAVAAHVQTVSDVVAYSVLGVSLPAFMFDPNVIFLYFVVAMLGIYVEFSHPGTIIPGIVGGIALLLFLFTASFIAPNWLGLIPLLLAFVLLVLDVKLPAHGVLTVGAVIALISGAFLFFQGGGAHARPPIAPVVVYTMGGMVGLIGLTLVVFVMRAYHQRVITGVEGMIGARVTAITPLHPSGRVMYAGENWAAQVDPPAHGADPGAELRIVRVERLCLHVEPVHEQNAAAESVNEIVMRQEM